MAHKEYGLNDLREMFLKFFESKETHNQQLGNYYQSVHLKYDSNYYFNSYHILNKTHALNHHGICQLRKYIY